MSNRYKIGDKLVVTEKDNGRTATASSCLRIGELFIVAKVEPHLEFGYIYTSHRDDRAYERALKRLQSTTLTYLLKL